MSRPVRLIVLALAATALTGVVAAWAFGQNPALQAPPGLRAAFPAPETWPNVSWLRIDDPDLAGPGWDTVAGVAADGPLIVAWGESSAPDPAVAGGNRVVGTVWTSADGSAWERHEIRFRTGETLVPWLVALGPAGYLAVGTRDPNNPVGVVVASSDGRQWAEVERPPADGWSQLVAIDSGYVLLGSRAGRWVAWATADGRAWSEMAMPGAFGDLEFLDLAVSPNGLVAAGRAQRGRDWDAVVWQITANGTWAALAEDDPVLARPAHGASIYRLVPFAGGLFATGGAGELPDCLLIFGAARASLGPPTADHCAGLPPAFWVSVDGARWRPVDGPRPAARLRGPIWIESAAAGGEGIVALIDEAPPGADRRAMALWTSRDGIEWSRIGAGMRLDRDYVGPELVGLPGRVVAFGGANGGDDIAVWVGVPDLQQ